MIGPQGEEVDGELTQALTMQVMQVLKEHLEPPFERQRVYESVNALAIAASLVVGSTGAEELVEMFLKSFETNLKLFVEAQDEETGQSGPAVH